jgi:hypothetical protein
MSARISAKPTNADTSHSELAPVRDTRGYSWVVVACAAVLGLLAGFTAGRNGARGEPAVEAPRTLQAWLTRAATAGGAHPSPELRRELAGSPPERRRGTKRSGQRALWQPSELAAPLAIG